MPVPVIRNIQDAVRRRFAEMEARGDLDWLPDLSLGEYEVRLLVPARTRRPERERHEEFVRKLNEHEAALKAAIERVWTELQSVLDEAGVPKERRTLYRGVVSASCTAAMNSEPGSSEEKRQLDEYILEPRWTRLGLDTALAQKLAGVALSRLRELAESFPPDPRPKR